MGTFLWTISATQNTLAITPQRLPTKHSQIFGYIYDNFCLCFFRAETQMRKINHPTDCLILMAH